MAKEMYDFGLTPNNDLAVTGGDFAVIESTAAHQKRLIVDVKNDYKENPTICVGALDYLNDEDVNSLPNEIAKEFVRDGMNVKKVAISPAGVIESNAYYP